MKLSTIDEEDSKMSLIDQCTQVSITLTDALNSMQTEAELNELDLDLQGPFCRLCLRKNNPMSPLFPTHRASYHLASMIEEVTGIRMLFTSDYNSFVCCECQKRVEDIYKVRLRWQVNDALVRAIREDNDSIEPIKVVMVPGENLTQDHSSEDYFPTVDCSEHSDAVLESKIETIVDQCSFQEDSKETDAGMQETLKIDTETEDATASQQSKTVVEHSEEEEKEQLIKWLMRKIRRDILPGKKSGNKIACKVLKKRRQRIM